jgi:hypothetical protein
MASAAPQSASGQTSSMAPSGSPSFGKPILTPQQTQNMDLYKTGITGVMQGDDKYINETLTPAAYTGQQQVESSRLIKTIAPGAAFGAGASTVNAAARWLAQILPSQADGSPNKVVSDLLANPVAGDELKKLLLQQSAGAVRAMGAREPGSVISLFKDAYPSFETSRGALTTMENVFQMQGQFTQDRLAANQAFMSQQVQGLRDGNPYMSVKQFDQQWVKQNADMYLRAAEAMSGMKEAYKNMSKAQIAQVLNLIPSGETMINTNGDSITRP